MDFDTGPDDATTLDFSSATLNAITSMEGTDLIALDDDTDGLMKGISVTNFFGSVPADLVFAQDNPEVLGGDTNGVLHVGAGATNILGGFVKFYGDTHASKAGDIEFGNDSTIRLSWDLSETNWDFDGENVKGIGTLAAGASSSFGLTGTEGTLHVHTATAGAVTAHTNADDLVVENSTGGGISILTPEASNADIAFGSPSENRGALIEYGYNSGGLTLLTKVVGHTLALRADNNVTNLTLSGASGSELATFVRDVVLTNGDLIITAPTTPASAAATGTIGTIAWDTGYLYVCTATDTWERVAIASW